MNTHVSTTRQILGTAPDGTPIADLIAATVDLQAEVATLKRRLREIHYLCQARPSTFDSERLARVRELST